MSRLPAAPLLLASLMLAGLIGAARAQEYYPLGEGLSWTYSSGETQSFAGLREVDGRSVQVLVHYLAGQPVSEEYLEYGEMGVISHGSAAGGERYVYDPPLNVYPPPPLTPGQTWSSTTVLPGFTLTLHSEVIGMGGVSTPVGRFNALQIRQTTLTSNGGRTELDLFLVPGVGIVRFVTQDGTVIDLIERTQ